MSAPTRFRVCLVDEAVENKNQISKKELTKRLLNPELNKSIKERLDKLLASPVEHDDDKKRAKEKYFELLGEISPEYLKYNAIYGNGSKEKQDNVCNFI